MFDEFEISYGHLKNSQNNNNVSHKSIRKMSERNKRQSLIWNSDISVEHGKRCIYYGQLHRHYSDAYKFQAL